MKTWTVNIILATILLALSGCSTIPVQQLAEKYDPPILSATDAQSMIHVEVTPLQPIAADRAIAALRD